jgi:hypothetical protein
LDVSRSKAAAVLMVPLALGFVVPLIGPLASLVSPLLARSLGPTVWPGRRSGARLGVLALAALWLPVTLVLLVPFGREVLESVLPTAHWWTVIPLCGPRDALTLVLPALAALIVYGASSAASVRQSRPALWPVGASAATYAYTAVVAALEATGTGGFIC